MKPELIILALRTGICADALDQIQLLSRQYDGQPPLSQIHTTLALYHSTDHGWEDRWNPTKAVEVTHEIHGLLAKGVAA